MENHTPRKKQMQHVKRKCHRCHGSGRAPCQICGGSGQVAQGRDDRGGPKFGRCEGCFGTKTRRCLMCSGTGFA